MVEQTNTPVRAPHMEIAVALLDSGKLSSGQTFAVRSHSESLVDQPLPIAPPVASQALGHVPPPLHRLPHQLWGTA